MTYKLIGIHANAPLPGTLTHAVYNETLTRVIAAFREESDALAFIGMKVKADEVNARVNRQRV